MFERRKVAALVAEFLGTGLLTLLFVSALRSQLAIAFFIAITTGLTLALVTFIFGRVSNGYFNPAITIGLWTARQLSTVSMFGYVAVQLLAGWSAYHLFSYLSGASLPMSKTHYSGRTLVAEAIGTAVVAMALASVAIYQRYSQAIVSSFFGLSYAIGIIAGSTVVGISFLNPAVALGAHTWGWSTYVLGPVLGAIIGINLYALLFTEDGAKNLAAAVNSGSSSKSGKKKK